MSNLSKETFGARLRREREAANKSVRQTASAIGISAPYLSGLETGRISNPPSEQVIRALANEIGDDPDYLLWLAGRIPESVLAMLHGNWGATKFITSLASTPQRLTDVLGSVRQVLEGAEK